MVKGERLNSITHLVGFLLAVTGLTVLVTLAVRQDNPWKIVSVSIYGTTLVLLYGASTLYHSLSGRAKRVFRSLDHHAIYLLIAGTYTPFSLVTLHGDWGWSLFGAVWTLSVAGIVVESRPHNGPRIVPVALYLLTGWLVVIALRPLLKALPVAGIVLLLAGGVFYTGGVVFYALDKRVRHGHGIWHLCVLAGSVCHYLAIAFYVL
ncbi:MAG: PAQR family membrane homeostasis protein TrhA [Acidiferrobacterales bacterium]